MLWQWSTHIAVSKMSSFILTIKGTGWSSRNLGHCVDSLITEACIAKGTEDTFCACLLPQAVQDSEG